jgi:hypothetical protein
MAKDQFASIEKILQPCHDGFDDRIGIKGHRLLQQTAAPRFPL